MKYQQRWTGTTRLIDKRVQDLIGHRPPAVPVIHAPKGKRSHPAGLGALLYLTDNGVDTITELGDWREWLVLEIAAAEEAPGMSEPPPPDLPGGGSWNLVCGQCGHRLSKKDSELFEQAVRALVARRGGVARASETITLT